MRVKAKRVKGGFLIPLLSGLENKKEIEVEIKEEFKEESTAFLRYLSEIYGGRENISKLTDEEALESALKDKYEL